MLDESYATIKVLFGTTECCQGQDPMPLFIDTLILESKRRHSPDRNRPELLWSSSSNVRQELVSVPALWVGSNRAHDLSPATQGHVGTAQLELPGSGCKVWFSSRFILV